MDKFFKIDEGEFIKFYDDDTVGAVSLEEPEDFIPITFREIVLDSNYYVYTNVLEKICIIRTITDPYRFYMAPYFDDLYNIRVYTYAVLYGLFHSNHDVFFTYIPGDIVRISEEFVKLFNLKVIEVIDKGNGVFASDDCVYELDNSEARINNVNTRLNTLNFGYNFAICFEVDGYYRMETYDVLNSFIKDLLSIIILNEYLCNRTNVDAIKDIDELWISLYLNRFYNIEDVGHEYMHIPKIHLLLKKENGLPVVIENISMSGNILRKQCLEIFNKLERIYEQYNLGELDKNKQYFNRDFEDILSTVDTSLPCLESLFVYRTY